MMNLTVKKEIISLKNKGISYTEIARILGINRKTVKKYWEEYSDTLQKVEESKIKGDKAITKKLLNSIEEKPTYNTTNRGPRKYTQEIDAELDNILEYYYNQPIKKKLNSVQIHKLLVERGFDIGRVTIAAKIKEKIFKFENKNIANIS